MGRRRSDSSSGFPLCTATGAFSSSSTLPSVLHNPSYTTETHNISYPLDSRSTQHAARGAVANLPLHAVQAAKLAGGGASLTPIISVDRGTRSAERSTRCTSAMTACEGSWTETLPDTGSFAPRSAEEGGGGGAKAASAAAAAAAAAAAQLSSTVVPGTFTVGERPTLPENANLRTRIDYIQYQLDCFEPGSEILPGYRMCGGGPGQRFVGGTPLFLVLFPLYLTAHRRPPLSQKMASLSSPDSASSHHALFRGAVPVEVGPPSSPCGWVPPPRSSLDCHIDSCAVWM